MEPAGLGAAQLPDRRRPRQTDLLTPPLPPAWIRSPPLHPPCLLTFAEAVAQEAGLPTLRLYTNAAMTENLTFYPQLGYEEIDRRTNNGFERVFFSKHLRRRPDRP